MKRLLSVLLLPLALGACGGPAGVAPDLEIGRAIMVEGPVFGDDAERADPAMLADVVWGALSEGLSTRENGMGAAVRFAASGSGQTRLDIAPAKIAIANGRASFSDFNGFEIQKGFKPADFAYLPDVPMRVLTLGAGKFATEYAYGDIHLIGVLVARPETDRGYDWRIWLDESALRALLPVEPGIWWKIKGFFARLFGIESDNAVGYVWDNTYPDKNGEVVGKDLRFTSGGKQLAAFIKRHADTIFLPGRAIRLQPLTPAEVVQYKARPPAPPQSAPATPTAETSAETMAEASDAAVDAAR